MKFFKEIANEASIGNYRTTAIKQKAQAQMGAMFANNPEQRARDLETFRKRESGLNRLKARDEKSRKDIAAKQLASDIARLPELKAEYEAMKDKYKKLGGSNWQYADREQNLTDSERAARSMEGAMNNLWRTINAAEKAQGVTEGMLDNPGAEDSPVAQAIIRRILLQRTDLLSKYGPEKVGQAVDEVAGFVGDVDEIGSSDVSGWIRHVEQMLGNMGDGVAEGAPIVVMPRADRLKKAESTKVRYQGDIVPPTKPPSTEKRGVKGRPGQRPMPEQGVAEGIMNKIANKVMGAAPEQPKYKVGQRVKYETSPHQPDWKDGGSGVGVITAYKNGHYMINGNPVNHFEIKGVVDQGVAEGYDDEEHPIRDDGNEGRPGKQRYPGKLPNKEQGVAEGSREQVDSATVWEVSFDYGPHQSDKVKVRASSQEEAEQKGMRAAKKLGHRFPQLNWAMPAEQGVVEAEKKLHPETWHDVDKKLGKAVDKMSQAEKVAKGFAHPDTLKKKGVAEGFKNTYNVGDRVDGPLGTGTIVAISKNINVDGQVKVKLDDPSLAGADGHARDTFVLNTMQLKHIADESSLAQMRDYFNQPDDSIAVDRAAARTGKNPEGIPHEIQTLVNKMYHAGKITPQEFEILRKFQQQTKINVGIKEANMNSGNQGYDNMLAVMKAVDAGHDATFNLGGEPITLDYNEARFLGGKYKAFLKAGRQEEFLKYMESPVAFDHLMKQLRDLMDKQRNFRGSVQGERGVDEGVVDAVKAGVKKVVKAVTGPDDEELLQRLEKETGGKRPEKKDSLPQVKESEYWCKIDRTAKLIPEGYKKLSSGYITRILG